MFAGDSAGAGLSLAALTVIRDMGLPMPAGAVLISPWVDLTHSFPSVMKTVVLYGVKLDPELARRVAKLLEGTVVHRIEIQKSSGVTEEALVTLRKCLNEVLEVA